MFDSIAHWDELHHNRVSVPCIRTIKSCPFSDETTFGKRRALNSDCLILITVEK
jgi:hypothetical protein